MTNRKKSNSIIFTTTHYSNRQALVRELAAGRMRLEVIIQAFVGVAQKKRNNSVSKI